MVKTLFFATLVLFPFGQIIKFGQINLFDVFIGLLAFYTLIKYKNYPSWYIYFANFLFAAFFSLLLNYDLFTINGLLYLIRLWFYSMLAVYVFNTYKEEKSKVVLTNSLLLVSVFSAVFGWIQYFLYPDIRSFTIWQWDDHLLRIVGTFIDPTFLGIVIVLGIVIAVFKNKNLVAVFLLLSLAFTYSRASFLSVLPVLLFKKKFILLVLFAFFVFITPKMIGEGTNLARTNSSYQKIKNYKDSILLISKSPVFGLGFSNICMAKAVYLGETNVSSHSCSGLDSSVLFVLATTGIIGLFFLIAFVYKVAISIGPSSFILILSFVAVLIHSIFSNSLFYPHVMFWLFILLGLETNKTK